MRTFSTSHLAFPTSQCQLRLMERDESERQPSWLEQQVAYLEAQGSGRLTMTVGSEEFALSQSELCGRRHFRAIVMLKAFIRWRSRASCMRYGFSLRCVLTGVVLVPGVLGFSA